MLKINKKVEYALMALKFMLDEKSPFDLTTAREVCDKFNTPFDTTAKVMQAMNNHKILTSVKGIKGGYRLTRQLDQISYLELEHIVEKRDNENFCDSHKGQCELYEICNISEPMEVLNRRLNEYLAQLTVLSLLRGTNSKKQISNMESK